MSFTTQIDPHISCDKWFRFIRTSQKKLLRLVCFPHAGGSASFFRSWAGYLPDTVELAAVCYPGREDRICDPLAECMEDLAGPLAAACAQLPAAPMAFFGHSMGASVAYETALRLERDHGIVLTALFASARSAPGHGRRDRSVHGDDDALVRDLVKKGGTEATALLDDELRELVLPAVRADYRLVDQYDARASTAVVSAPLTAYYGLSDEDLHEHSVRAWSEFTRAGFSLRAMPGGHFYLNSDTTGLVRDILRQLSAI
jgi:pyochelin biosynthetic protein PchC